MPLVVHLVHVLPHEFCVLGHTSTRIKISMVFFYATNSCSFRLNFFILRPPSRCPLPRVRRAAVIFFVCCSLSISVDVWLSPRRWQFDHFMNNFGELSSSGFFKETAARWQKWADEYQHLPLSIARIACCSFYRGKWAGSDIASEHAVGQEFARAFLFVLWPSRYSSWVPRTELEKQFRDVLAEDLLQAVTLKEKDRLTLGLFSKVNGEANFRAELEEYAESAFGECEIVEEGGGYEENPAPSVSNFRQIWEFPLLYQWACYMIYFVPIHQQLVESFFSKYDTCTRKHDSK